MQGLSSNALRGIDQELKEAVCEALVNLTCEQISGAGDDNLFILAPTPRRAIVSGQLLPRFHRTTGEDETSDIRIAAIGLDFQIAHNATGIATIRPWFSSFIRVFPTWADINDDESGPSIDFRLRPQIQATINARITQLRQQRFAEEDIDRPDWRSLSPDERSRIRSARAVIEDEARRRAYDEQGIRLEVGESQTLIQEDGVDTPGADAAAPTDDQTPSRLRLGRLLQQGREIPVQLLDPAEAPPKWRRFDFKVEPFAWPLDVSGDQLDQLLAQYSAAVQAEAIRQVRDWLMTPEGRDLAWRQVPVVPQDVDSKASWEAYLTRARLTAISEPALLPDVGGATIQIDRLPSFVDTTLASVRVTFDNRAAELVPAVAATKTETLFCVRLQIQLPKQAHQPLRLDRVEPSYRYRHFLDYPAIGLNCGVVATTEDSSLVLETTWSPRFVQPRIVPRKSGIPLSFKELASDKLSIPSLQQLPTEYRDWIDEEEQRLRPLVRQGLSAADADRESRELDRDIAARRREAGYIERGIQLLAESQKAESELAAGGSPEHLQVLTSRAAPWRAWLLTNQAFLQREKNDDKRGWRLFQLAFILAHVPTLASRMPEFRDYCDASFDEDSASLLYFPTGGGKSEAFYGTLLFAMFLDKLRGKNRGVTAMVRYPLRLLTLQQGQRLLKLVIHAELVRKAAKVGTWPFEIGFWVGGANTPNRYSYVPAAVPLLSDRDHPDDTAFNEDALPTEKRARERAERYLEEREAYNKVPECPYCSRPTGLRRYEAEGPTAKRLAIVCFDPACGWNVAHGATTPLPFLLTDDTIYARAPSVVLGTIDKMAMLGQNTNTIRQLLGMFGLSRWIAPTGHMTSATADGEPQDGAGAGYKRICPAFASGEQVFHDPFPALIIQDEAHLLEESLGTFSGLFDTLFELALQRINEIGGTDLHVARQWTGDAWGPPRMPKVIAATATISNPDRQLEVLYQRKPLRFPYPGSDIYRSFFSLPDEVPAGNAARLALSSALPAHEAPERTAPWMRLYVSLMTNDATHTVTVVAVLGAFHTLITRLWRGLLDPARRDQAIALLRQSQSAGAEGDWRRAAIDRALTEGRASEVMALIDLHRVALAYVTNKKGGDQVMDALDVAVRLRHRARNEPLETFVRRLISGGVDMKEIQSVMREAEASFASRDYGDIERAIRCIVATSAISHGVDVDRFNSMFFAGLPSDVAEYIQASSRVGRTHVGFVMLIPTPQSRRDRYVVETHDIFHRFLERMIAAPAVERWAENAIRRAMASIVQTWAILKESEAFKLAPDDRKRAVDPMDAVYILKSRATQDQVAFADDLGGFALRAIGYFGRGQGEIGKPVHASLYRSLAEREVDNFASSMRANQTRVFLQEYWKDLAPAFRPPMTSLRDVDEAGWIVPAAFDPAGATRKIDLEKLARVMRVIRRQRGTRAETDPDTAGGART